MKQELKQSGVSSFAGFSINRKVVTLKLKFKYDEVLTGINLLQGLNTDVTIHAKPASEKALNLGVYTIDKVNFDKDGNSVVTFKSIVDSVNFESIYNIIDKEFFQVRFLAVLEIEENEE